MAYVGILHPGQMGTSVGAALAQGDNVVQWAGEGRSAATRDRATEAGFVDVGSVDLLCKKCDFLFSVCPPDRACTVAEEVARYGYDKYFIDCNAVASDTAGKISAIIQGCGGTMIDAGIIGPPAWQADTTRLYLSGPQADQVVPLFTDSRLDARSLGSGNGHASALKMAYAGWTKGSAALLMTMYAMAKEQGVEGALLEEWSLSLPGLDEKLNKAIIGNAPKGWRFVGEMKEIAVALRQSGLPGTWFDAAGDVYESMGPFKNVDKVNPDLVVDSILDNAATANKSE